MASIDLQPEDVRATTAIVLKVGNRFFSKYENKRVQTAWSLAGAKLFGEWREEDIERIEKVLIDKGYAPQRVKVELEK